MISLNTGTPGSGKSLNAARMIMMQLRFKRNVIANFPINLDVVSKKGRRKIGKFIYLKNDELTIDYLKRYAEENHAVGKESQTEVYIDEAGTMFNSREFGAKDRKPWLDFFATHRHYGYDFILMTQHPMQLDRQIRYKVEYEVRHRKVNNYRSIGFLLTLLGLKTFVAVKSWYGVPGADGKCGSEFFIYKRKYGRLYKTMMKWGGEDHGKEIGVSSDQEEAAAEDSKTIMEEVPEEENPISYEDINRQFVKNIQKWRAAAVRSEAHAVENVVQNAQNEGNLL